MIHKADRELNTVSINPREQHMECAIIAAREAKRDGDYAVGCAIALDEKIITSAGNRTHIDNDPTLHAEMIAISDASRILKTKDLRRCVLYSTHEPCPMCMGAIVWARITTVIFGASMQDHINYRDKYANQDWKWRVIDVRAERMARQGDPKVTLISGFMREQCCRLFHA